MRNSQKNLNGPWRVLRRLLPVSFALALTLSLGTADAWAKGNAPPPVAAAPAPASEVARTLNELPLALPLGMVDNDMLAYAQREAQAQGLEDFQGGAFIVIGASGLAIVLFVLLLIVLL